MTHVLHIEDKSAQHVPLSDGFAKAHGTSSTQEGGKGLDGMMGGYSWEGLLVEVGDVGPPVNRSTHQPINHSPDLAWLRKCVVASNCSSWSQRLQSYWCVCVAVVTCLFILSLPCISIQTAVLYSLVGWYVRC